MIGQDTVFVLGAGASHAYGFPLGADLARQTWKGLRDRHSRLCRSLTRCDVSSHQTAATEAFAATDPDSLDDLVETRREFAALVKLAIVCQLIPIELESIQPRLYPDLHPSGNRDSVDWYRYLLNEIMLSSAPDLIRSNRLAVVKRWEGAGE